MGRILVVEDDEPLAQVLTYQLRRAGHSPIVARDGETALREARSHPDLILLDLGLPDISGYDVLRRLSREPATAQIPVVVVSGNPDVAALAADGGTHAVAAILRKPVSGLELCAVVNTVLAAPAECAEWHESEAAEQRARLLYRLITEGSNRLVRMVCLCLEADRARRHGFLPAPAPNWSDLARAGRQEGLLSSGEGALLAARPLDLVEVHRACEAPNVK